MTETRQPRRRRRAETMAQFVSVAVERSALYRDHLGEDIAGKLAHHAERLAHHHRAYVAELARIQSAAREVGIQLPALPPRS